MHSVNFIILQASIQDFKPPQLLWQEVIELTVDAFMGTVEDVVDIVSKAIEYGCIEALSIGYSIGMASLILQTCSLYV